LKIQQIRGILTVDIDGLTKIDIGFWFVSMDVVPRSTCKWLVFYFFVQYMSSYIPGSVDKYK